MKKNKSSKASKGSSPAFSNAKDAMKWSDSLESKSDTKKEKIKPVYTLEEMVNKMKKDKNNQHPAIDWGEDVGEEIVEWNEEEAFGTSSGIKN